MTVNALSITWEDLISSGPGFSNPCLRFLRLDGEAGPTVSREEMDEIRASLGGDGDAFAGIVRRHQKQVAARMWSFTRNRSVLEELVHDVFVEAYLSLRSFRGEAPFHHWLLKIATRVGFRHWREEAKARRNHPFPLDDLANVLLAEDTDPSLAGAALHSLLALLHPRDRLVLTLIYLEGCSTEEAAQLTGWSQTMVKVQSFRARGRLRKLLKEKGWEADRG